MRRYHTDRMANYLIVVPRGNPELLDLLSVAFRGHAGFSVVVDRRGTDSDGLPISSKNDDSGPSRVEAQRPSNVESERRGGRMSLGPDDIVVAERAERADRASGGEPSRSFQRIPVRRRRARRPSSSTGGSRQQAQGLGAATVC
jgi:hypothetical protein